MSDRGAVNRPARAVAVAVAHASFVVVTLIGLAAATSLGTILDRLWVNFPRDIGARGAVLAVVLALVAFGLVRVVQRASDDVVRRWVPWAPLGLLVLVRVVLILVAPTPLPPDSDPLYLHELAVGVLDGGNPLVAHRPMGFSTMLAALYAVFGVHPWLAELLNLAMAILAGVMLYLLVLPAWGIRAGGMALALYAIVPSQALLVTTMLTETAYTALLVTALAVAAAAVRRARLAVAVAAGAALALSQYVRPMSQAFLVIVAALPFLASLRPARAGSLAAAAVLAFVVVLLPIAAYNLTNFGAVSLSTSAYGGWSVFVGANQEHDGKFNEDDQRILAAMEGSVWERSEILGDEGLERIASDPGGFAALAVRKFHVLWANDAYAVNAALASTVPGWARWALIVASQAMYVALLALAAVLLWRVRLRPPPEALLLGGVIVMVAVTHTFLEVQARYHAYTLPILCALAAVALVGAGQPSVSREPMGRISHHT